MKRDKKNYSNDSKDDLDTISALNGQYYMSADICQNSRPIGRDGDTPEDIDLILQERVRYCMMMEAIVGHDEWRRWPKGLQEGAVLVNR